MVGKPGVGKRVKVVREQKEGVRKRQEIKKKKQARREMEVKREGSIRRNLERLSSVNQPVTSAFWAPVPRHLPINV